MKAEEEKKAAEAKVRYVAVQYDVYLVDVEYVLLGSLAICKSRD